MDDRASTRKHGSAQTDLHRLARQRRARFIAGILLTVGGVVGAGLGFLIWLGLFRGRDGEAPFGGLNSVDNFLVIGAFLGSAIATPIAWLITGTTKSTDKEDDAIEVRPLESTVKKAENWLDNLE